MNRLLFWLRVSRFFHGILVGVLLIPFANAAEKTQMSIVIDRPGAILYLNGEKQATLKVREANYFDLLPGRHQLFIERAIRGSVYSFQASRVLEIGTQPVHLKLKLAKKLNPVWQQHFERLLKNNQQKQLSYPELEQLQMVDIPAGEFMMGDNEVMFARPAHRVSVPAFKMSANEISYAIYDRFVRETGYDLPDDSWGRGDQPVTNVSWYDAQLFIRWLNSVLKPEQPFRLPSEAEWEYAARAGTRTMFWWGDHRGRNRANCSDCGNPWYREIVPVYAFAANPFGLKNTSGNDYEWVQDCWLSNYEQAPVDGSARQSGYCQYRVIRGGCWFFNHREMTSASRSWNTATKRDDTIGLRLAQDG